MRQKVFVLGASGNVGRELISQIVTHDGSEQNANPTDVIGMADSKHMIVKEGPLDPNILLQMAGVKEDVKTFLETQGKPYSQMEEILMALKKKGHSWEVIIVDVTAAKWPDITQFHLDAIGPKYGLDMVTANKNPVSLWSVEEFKALTGNHGDYNYNTTVMAGGGAITFVGQCYDNHDSILSIEWCFSGTLGYIASELEKWEKKFSLIVKEALAKGYTEPHPWDDLSGLDVARKLLILARSAGFKVNIEDIEIVGFIDKKYGEITDVDTFLKAIEQQDSAFAEDYKKAMEAGYTFKYVATLKIEDGKPKMKVGLKLVSHKDSLWALKGTANIAIIETATYDKTRPMIFQWPGAGLDTTALAIRRAISGMLPAGLPRANGNY